MYRPNLRFPACIEICGCHYSKIYALFALILSGKTTLLYTERVFMTPKEIKSMLRGFSYTKSLGQNFIFDAGILNSIADASSVGSSDSVLEIGPGAGTLTNVLCRRANKVLCIEKDARLEPVLSRTLSEYTNVEVIFDDFLSVNLKAIICDKLCEPFRVVANLPYYITTPILFKFFESDTDWSGITVMVQKEVAQRLALYSIS